MSESPKREPMVYSRASLFGAMLLAAFLSFWATTDVWRAKCGLEPIDAPREVIK